MSDLKRKCSFINLGNWKDKINNIDHLGEMIVSGKKRVYQQNSNDYDFLWLSYLQYY